MTHPVDQFTKALELMREEKLDEALGEFLELRDYESLAPFCFFNIAKISNMIGEPEEAYELYYKALAAKPDIASQILNADHSSINYVFKGLKDEKENTKCPLCDKESVPEWCYPLFEANGYNDFFNPIRMWMYCEPCNHMFARNFPERLFIYNTGQRKANPVFFPYYSKILSSIRGNGYATGMSLFEVGIGACECLLAAREMGYETFGIDVIERHVDDAKKIHKLNAETADFNEYKSDRLWDVIIMGDVLEHVSDPDQALAKAESMLSDDGALWISTPSFECAYTQVVGHNDVMRRQQFHLNYFSRESLYMLLERNHLIPVDYIISGHFNGSMEVTAIKEARLR